MLVTPCYISPWDRITKGTKNMKIPDCVHDCIILLLFYFQQLLLPSVHCDRWGNQKWNDHSGAADVTERKAGDFGFRKPSSCCIDKADHHRKQQPAAITADQPRPSVSVWGGAATLMSSHEYESVSWSMTLYHCFSFSSGTYSSSHK